MSAKKIIGAMTAGVVIGAIAGMMIDPISDKTHKRINKCANNMFRTIGTIVDDIVSR